MTTIRVVLPGHLRTLAHVGAEVSLDIAEPPTLGAVVAAVEQAYPVLRGTIRDQGTGKRRSFVRYFACNTDMSHEPPDTPLPEPVVSGAEPFMVVGAMAGG
jgi:sulfur-carrier protein